jgi:hypothetical protein
MIRGKFRSAKIKNFFSEKSPDPLLWVGGAEGGI